MSLRWEYGSVGWLGYSGELVVAMVVLVDRGDNAGKWNWQLHGVHRPRGWKHSGFCGTQQIARRAAGRAWKRWCMAAGLTETEPTGTRQ
jgi:hypothetical protein